MVNILPQNYKHPLEDKCATDMKKIMVATDILSDYYDKFVKEALLPDLIGKAVRVSSTQFPKVHKIILNISGILNIKPPEAFVVESLYYDVNAEGLNDPWLQISAKTIYDLPDEELIFLIGRQLTHIQCGHMYDEVLMEQTIEALNLLKHTPAAVLNIVGGLEATQTTYRFVMAKWSRISEFTADAGAYLLCDKNIKACVNAILTTVFNNRLLAKEINVGEYIKQTKKINSLTSTMATCSKLDELMPYGPFRIQELIRFASAERAV